MNYTAGQNHASRLVNLGKQWLPDVILGLGSRSISQNSLEDNVLLHLNSDGEMQVHPWMLILANLEIHEMRLEEEDDDGPVKDEKLPAFKKTVEIMVRLLRIKHEVFDSFGLVLLLGSATGLQRNELGLVLGLMRFVFEKLLVKEKIELGKLNMIVAYIQELYPQVESRIEEAQNDEDLDVLRSIRG